MKIPLCADCNASWPGVLPVTEDGIRLHAEAVAAKKCTNCYAAFQLTVRAFACVLNEVRETRTN